MNSYKFYLTLNKQKDSVAALDIDKRNGQGNRRQPWTKSVTVKLLWATVFLSVNEKMRKLNVINSEVSFSMNMI